MFSDYLTPIKVSREKFQNIPLSLRIGVFVEENESNDTELEALIFYLEQQQGSIEIYMTSGLILFR